VESKTVPVRKEKYKIGDTQVREAQGKWEMPVKGHKLLFVKGPGA
jgi:hypothetical protein